MKRSYQSGRKKKERMRGKETSQGPHEQHLQNRCVDEHWPYNVGYLQCDNMKSFSYLSFSCSGLYRSLYSYFENCTNVNI